MYEDAEIEKARKIFSGECKFIAAALNSNAIPPEEGNEVAFEPNGNEQPKPEEVHLDSPEDPGQVISNDESQPTT